MRGFLEIFQQALARLGGHVALQEQAQEEIDQFRRRSSCRACAATAAGSVRRAETDILGRGQRQGKVLAKQQRLAVQPGRAAVPALDRGRVEDVLAQLLQRRRQGGGADSAFQAR